MKLKSLPHLLLLAALLLPAIVHADQVPYRIVMTGQLTGTGRIDYVFADSSNRRLYVPRGNSVLAFNLDTLEPLTPIPGLMNGHGVAVDPLSNHAFSSSNPILMWDATSLQPIKTITPQGRPDGILFEPDSERVYVFSHSAPNVTVINPKDGSIAGTIDLGGAPEQAASDGNGHLYVDLEDKDAIGVVDVNAMKLTGTYSLQGKGGGPGGLGLDAKNGILFAFCHEPAVCVILSAADGKILDTLPIGKGTDGGGFNPHTMEAFSSQGDGTMTIIKENSPTDFSVEQTLQTMPRAKVCTLDLTTDHIITIATDRPTPSPGASPSPMPSPSAASPAPSGFGGPGGRRGGFGGFSGPAMLHILVIGR
jgi:DNA-binding beta-propeller fold protein YncE